MQIDIMKEAQNPTRALKMVETIASLRKRREAIDATILDFGMGLKEELGLEISVDEILAGLNITEKTITIISS